MCWISETKPSIKIARKDIPIFKICLRSTNREKVRSCFMRRLYTLNKETTAKGVNPLGIYDMFGGYEMNVGIHSYHSDCQVSRDTVEIFFICSPNGKCIPSTIYDRQKPNIRVNGYIPKGARYVINERGEYVSDRIVLTDVLDINFAY